LFNGSIRQAVRYTHTLAFGRDRRGAGRDALRQPFGDKMDTPAPSHQPDHAPSNEPELTTADAPTAAHYRRLLIILVVASVLWRIVRYAVAMPIWGDEAFLACNFVMRGFAGMIKPLVYGQIAPLGFMWANLAATKLFGLSEWGLRLVPTLAGITGLLLFVRLARQVLWREAALMAVGIFAGSYYIVRHSVEIKPYSFDLMFSIALTVSAWGVLCRPDRWSRWAVLTLLAMVATWCSYPSVFVSGGIGLVLTYALLSGQLGRKAALGWFTYGVLLCGTALAMYVLYAKPHAEAVAHSALFEDPASWARTFPDISKPWTLPVWFFREHLGTMFSYPQGGSAPRSAATFVLFCVGIVRLWRTKRTLVLLLLSPFLLNFVAAAMHKYPYGGSQRVVQHLAPAICLLAGAGLAVVLERFVKAEKLPSALTVASGILIAICIGGIVMDIVHPEKSSRVRRRDQAIRELVGETGPGDKWIVFNSTKRVPYAPYLGDWHGRGAVFVFDSLRWLKNKPEFAPPPDSISREPGQTVWIVAVYANREKGIKFPEDQWSAYVEAARKHLGGVPEHEEFIIKRQFDGAGNPIILESLRVYRFNPS